MYRQEKTISSYQSDGVRYQLLEITEYKTYLRKVGWKQYEKEISDEVKFYQIRLNRRIIKSDISSLVLAHKKFASLIIEDLMQQKFSF